MLGIFVVSRIGISEIEKSRNSYIEKPDALTKGLNARVTTRLVSRGLFRERETYILLTKMAQYARLNILPRLLDFL